MSDEKNDESKLGGEFDPSTGNLIKKEDEEKKKIEVAEREKIDEHLKNTIKLFGDAFKGIPKKLKVT